MSEVPQGWAVAPLYDIARINPRHPSDLPNEMAVSFVPMPSVRDDSPELILDRERPFGEVRTGFTHFAEGDVLFAKITPCMENGKGAVARNLTNALACGTTELHVLRPSEGISPEYLYHFLHQKSFRQAAKAAFTGSAGQARVPVSFLHEASIPLPPTSEQRRIITKLEALLDRVHASQLRLQSVPKILKRFRQAVLEAAYSGQLTADWRQQQNGAPEKLCEAVDGLPSLPSTWRWQEVGSVCETIVDCPHSTPQWAASGRICVRTTNFKAAFLDLSEVRYVSDSTFAERTRRLRPQAGDVLYSREGGILGIACMIPAGVELCLGQRMMLLRAGRAYNSTLLMHWLNSPFILRTVRELTGGTAAPHLNVGDIKSFAAPTPPFAEQNEIVKRIESLFAFGDRLEGRLKKATGQVERLAQSILAKAFRGELVPTEAALAEAEGRNFESAEVLLGRIRSEPAAKRPQKRGTRR